MAFLLCPTSALLWVGKWKAAIGWFFLHGLSVAAVASFAYSGVEPLHNLGSRHPEYLLYIANAIVAVPAVVLVLRSPPETDKWFSRPAVVIISYVVIGVTMYHYSKPFLV